jgi:hypothetical protein
MTRFMLFLAHWMDYPPAGIRFGAALPPLPEEGGGQQQHHHARALDRWLSAAL